MPIFEYKAKKGTAEIVTGQVDARTQEEAIEFISQQGFLPVSIVERKGSLPSVVTVSSGKVRPRELLIFSRQLASLLKAGIPILRALSLINQQVKSLFFKNIILSLHQEIKEGRSFSDALTKYPSIFSSFFVAMIKVGEESGNLKEMLARLAEYQERQEEISSKVRAALAYPIFMTFVGIGTITFILTFVMPRISVLFSSTGQSLPWQTQVLLAISSVFQHGWLALLVGFIVGGFLFSSWCQTPSGRSLTSRVKLKLPLIGDLVLKAELAQFARTMELLMKSGISLLKGLSIVASTLNNETLKQELLACRKDIEDGSSLGQSLRKSKMMPQMMTNLITVGEESGALGHVMGDIADFYEEETNAAIKLATTLLEPLMILAVGLVVGFMVVAMLLPIFQMDMLAS